jgi:hypothetical protein
MGTEIALKVPARIAYVSPFVGRGGRWLNHWLRGFRRQS